MPRRISPDVDMQILADIGQGVLYKDAALKYAVSPSYVSKLARGKKTLFVNVPKIERPNVNGVNIVEADIAEIVNLVKDKRLFDKDEDAILFLKTQIAHCVLKIKAYSDLLDTYTHKEG